MAQDLVFVKLEDLLPPEEPVRLTPADETIQDLAASIRSVGLLQPLVVRREGNKYRVVCGHRRFLALKIAKIEKIPVVVTDGDATRDLERMLAENIARKDMTPVEEAAFFDEALKRLGHTPKSLAEAIGRSLGYVKARLRILEYPPDIQKAIHEDGLKLAVADILARITDEEVRARYLQDAIERGISAQTAEFWYQIWKQHKDFREKGHADPRAAEFETPQEHIYGTCDVCGERRLFNELMSVVACKRCRKLIELFWEEYSRASEEGAEGAREGASAGEEGRRLDA